MIALALPAYLIRFNILGIPTTLLELMIYAIFLFGLFRLGYYHLLKCKRRVWLPIGLLLLAVVISIYVAPGKTLALGQFKAFFIDPILVFYLMICYLEPKDIKWTFYGLALSSLIVSLYSIIQQITGNLTADGRVIGIFNYSPNYVALYLAPMIVLLATYGLALLKNKKYLMAVIAGLIVLTNLFGLYLTGSRAGVLAVVGGVICFFILDYWAIIRTKFIYRFGLILLIMVAITGAWLAFRPDFSASGGRVTSSSNIRWQIWQTSIEMIKNDPIWGVGLGNYQNAFQKLTYNRPNFNEYISPLALTPHNLFLMFYLTTGLLGILSLVWLLIIFYRIGLKNLSNVGVKILLAAMTALILQGMVDASYFKNDLSLIFWLIFGLMLVLGDEKK